MKAIARRHRLIEHTADMGIFVRGTTLSQVFAEAARAVRDLMLDGSAVRPLSSEQVRLSAASTESLLVRWLTEILFLFETRLFAGSEFEVRMRGPKALSARIRGETFDAARHDFKAEVKAITRHRLEVERSATGWHAFFIVDL